MCSISDQIQIPVSSTQNKKLELAAKPGMSAWRNRDSRILGLAGQQNYLTSLVEMMNQTNAPKIIATEKDTRSQPLACTHVCEHTHMNMRKRVNKMVQRVKCLPPSLTTRVRSLVPPGEGKY